MTKAPERIFLPPADQVPFEDWNLLSKKLDGYDTEYVRKDLTPAVKQLEWWKPRKFESTRTAKTIMGEWCVWEIGGQGYVMGPGDSAGRFSGGDIEAAKAAAQADFERRVRECLV